MTHSSGTSEEAPRLLDIVVLAGGPSAERDVSLASGKAVHGALARVGHRCVLRDIGPDDLSALDQPADFFFIALHGTFGEDGTLQAELERRGLSYSGSGSLASRDAMDKVAAKRMFARAGILTPPAIVLDRVTLADFVGQVPLPAVVKPVDSGSSVDTAIVHDRAMLQSAAGIVVERHSQVLIERFVSGPELTVGILGEAALPVCQIVSAGAFYDYHAKYEADDTGYLFDIDLAPAVLQRVQQLSLQAHKALGCDVFSRVDWMIDAAAEEPHCLEVNTIPGFTDHSLLPKAAARTGLDFPALCDRIVRLSMEHRQS